MVSYALLIMILSDVTATLTSSRIVRTKYGDVGGVIVTPDARYLDAVEIFRGIPYAAAPVGNLRFMPPVSGALWSGVKLADKFAPVCPQKLPDISNETEALKRMPKGRFEYLKRLLPLLQYQSEDCLYLNIYVPAQVNENKKKYPVLVFIHGESYEWNSGNPYDGTVLASYGSLIVVTVNYRLGILGFLNTNINPNLNSKMPTNYGLMDQIAALHWLQDNISAFGGDVTNVTLMGHGFSAACINFLMMSPAVPDGLLFHRAILMSGSALSPSAIVQNSTSYTIQVAKYVNCSMDLSPELFLKCIRNRPLDELLNVPIQSDQFIPSFGPSIDGVVIEANLAEHKTDGIPGVTQRIEESKNDPSNKIYLKMLTKLCKYDILLGVVPAEAFFTFNADDIQYGIEPDRSARILQSFLQNTYKKGYSEILATIITEYTDWERPVQHPVTIRDSTLEALSDAQYAAPVIQTANYHSADRRNCYLYVFEYQTKFGDYQQRQGCVHGEELSYIFGAPLVGSIGHFPKNFTKSEMLLSEATIIYWSNFARTGTPNGPPDQEMVHGIRQERNRFKNIEWTAYDTVHKKYLSLDTKPKVKSHYHSHKLSFWINLVPELQRRISETYRNSQPQLLLQSGREFDMNSLYWKQNPYLTEEHNNATVIPIVIAESSSYNRTVGVNEIITNNPSSSPPSDSHNTESIILIATVVAGSVLLLLNISVFVAVYYRDKKSRARYNRNECHTRKCSDRRRCSCSPASSLRDAPDICSRISEHSMENGGIRNRSSGNSDSPSTVPKRTQLTSILKKPQQNYDQSSVLILQPGQPVNMPESSMELSNLGRFSTFPRRPQPSKMTQDITYENYTLDRKNQNFGDLRV